jgi:hypothetical protein
MIYISQNFNDRRPPKERARRLLGFRTNLALTTALLGRHVSRAQS